MIKKGTLITVIFAINTLIQLINQIVVTRLFGATLSLDIFLAAVALPTTLVTVLYGTLSDAFLPLYAHEKERQGKNAADFFFTHLIKLTLFMLLVTLIVGALTLPISQLLYSSRGTEFVKAVAFQMRILMFSLPFATIATLTGSYLYANRNFTRFPWVQMLGNGVNLALTVILFHAFGIWSLVISFIVSIVIQVLALNPIRLLNNRLIKVSMVPFFLAWLPLIVSSFAARSDTLLVRSMASNLPHGYLVYLNLTSRMFSIAAGVATIGIQILLLPHLVEHIAQKNYQRAVKIVVKAKIIGIIIAMFVSLALLLVGPFAIHALFVGGKFSQADAQTAIVFLPIFFFPAIGWSIQSIFFQPLMAIRKYFHLAVINLISLVLGWGSALLIRHTNGLFEGLTFGLIILIFSGIIGSEIVWQYYNKKFLRSRAPQS